MFANQQVPGQPDSVKESPWSLSEEQALFVFVHDLGPNWDIVSDALNTSLQPKSIFRKPEECKDRFIHINDEATLPGIPEGSARRLLQSMQDPKETDTLRSHFNMIIKVGQKLHGQRKQDPKLLRCPHRSHMVALTQVNPNWLNGGPIPMVQIMMTDGYTVE